MNLLKRLSKLLSGPSAPAGDVGLYYYVQCNRCGEVIRVRINPMNDLSANDDSSALFVRKVVVGTRCYNRIEVELTYNKDRKLIDSTVQGGKMVDEAAYEADQQNHPAPQG